MAERDTYRYHLKRGTRLFTRSLQGCQPGDEKEAPT